MLRMFDTDAEGRRKIVSVWIGTRQRLHEIEVPNEMLGIFSPGALNSFRVQNGKLQRT